MWRDGVRGRYIPQFGFFFVCLGSGAAAGTVAEFPSTIPFRKKRKKGCGKKERPWGHGSLMGVEVNVSTSSHNYELWHEPNRTEPRALST